MASIRSTTTQLVLPDDADGESYAPDPDRHYVRFLAQPVNVIAVEGLYAVPAITYSSLAEFEAVA